MKRKIAAILAADIAGYSRLVAEDEEETLSRLASYRAVFDDFVKRAGGRIFNTAGDAVLAEFTSAVEATRCAIDIQESLRTRNLAFPPSKRMEFRIGLTIGDVVERDGDLLGEGVNIAARLEGLAEPGGICVSQSVYDSVVNKLGVQFQDMGEQEVKNIPRPVHAFRIGLSVDTRQRQAVLQPQQQKSKSSAPLFGGIAALALIAALGGVWWFSRQPVPSQTAVAITAPQQTQAPQTQAPNTAPVVAAPQPAPVQPAPAAPVLPADPAEAFRVLAQQGGIVPEPKSAPEFYHNARSYETRGDAVAARRAYMAFANLKMNRLDPLLRLAALLRVQEGRAGAREVLADLVSSSGTPAAALVHALQFDGADRRARLEKFMAENREFTPASYLLAEEYGEDRLGTQQTLADRRKEFASLTEFLAADRDGKLQPFFMDHSVLAEWLDKARKRHATLDAQLKSTSAAPTMIYMRSNSGWMATVQTAEAASEIAWRTDPNAEFKSTPFSTTIDPRTNKPAPMPFFEFPGQTEQATFQVRYRDASGQWIGPFDIPFDWQQALLKSQRQILEQSTTSWFSFRNDAPYNNLLYYTHLVSYRCAVSKIEYALDDSAPKEIVLPPCDKRDPMAIPSNVTPYVRIPAGTKAVTVRLTYADGAQSDKVTIAR
ncbi:MAG: adenylate/guanylate cyclase domain-containing protein [Beijerinckiaceae bacterium]